MPSRKRKRAPNGPASKQTVFPCPNQLCQRTFKNQQGASNHFLYLSQCSKHVSTSTTEYWKQRLQEATRTAYHEPFVRTESDDEDDNDFDFDDNHPFNANIENVVLPAGPIQGVVLPVNGTAPGINVVKCQKGITHTISEYANINVHQPPQYL